MYKIAICDDQPESIKEIQKRIANYVQKNGGSISDHSYMDAKILLEDLGDGLYYDIIFMDIEMPEMNGLQVTRHIKNKCPDCLIIMVTSYQKYAIQAIEAEVFRYLVKGHLDTMFDVYLEAALKRTALNNTENYFILSARKQIKISCRDIVYCYKEPKMSVMVLKSEVIRERKSLQNLYRDLQKICDYFVMAERGYIINLYYVEKLEKNEIVLENQKNIPIGITYSEEVKTKLNDFWRKYL